VARADSDAGGELGLINTVWALVLPGMITAFNVIIVKNFLQTLPESMVESARIDGAGERSVVFRIYVPLPEPVLATVALWTAVGHWNAWFDPYSTSPTTRSKCSRRFSSASLSKAACS